MGDDMILPAKKNDNDRDLAVPAFRQAKVRGEPVAVDFVELAQRIGSYGVQFNQVPLPYAA
jgi:hypothetical protein